MDALDGARERHDDCVAATTSFGSSKTKSWAHSLATGEKRIAHGFVNRGGLDFFGRQKFIERAIDSFGARGEELLQIELVFCGHKIESRKNARKESKFEGNFLLLRGGDYQVCLPTR